MFFTKKIILIIVASVVFVASATLGTVYFVKQGADNKQTETEKNNGEENQNEKPITYILSNERLNIVIGGHYQLTIDPAPKKSIAWSSSAEDIASVRNGEIIGLSAGNADITARIDDQTLTCSVLVSAERVTSATLNLSKSSSEMVIGSDDVIYAYLDVNGKRSDETVSWTVSGDCDYETDGNSIRLGYTHTGEVRVTAEYGEAKNVYIAYVIPAKKEKLAAPVLRLNGETIEWDEIENAVCYAVKIAGRPTEYVEGTSYLNGDLLREMQTYKPAVKAVGDKFGGYTDSDERTISVRSLSLNITETPDYKITFTEYAGATGYTLVVGGEDVRAVTVGEEIDVSNIAGKDAELKIRADLGGGASAYSRPIYYTDETAVSREGAVYGAAYAQNTGINTDIAFITGGGAFSLKFCAASSFDSSTQATFVSDDWNVKENDVIIYKIMITDITKNVYSKRGEWDDGSETVTSLPKNYAPNLIGFNNKNANVINAAGELSANVWYDAYSVADKETGNAIDINAWVGPYQADSSPTYRYTAYIDCIHVIPTVLEKYELSFIDEEYNAFGTPKTVVYDKAIGDLPFIPEKTGYIGLWTLDGTVISSQTVWQYHGDKTAVLSYRLGGRDLDESYTGKNGSGTDTSYDGLPSNITLDYENHFGEDSYVSAKIHMEAGTYKTCEALVTNVDLFSDFVNGDVITYYLKIGQANTSATKDGEYSTEKTTFTLSQVPNPSGWGTNPVYIENASTHETVTSLTAGVWYKVVYIASNANNSTFKGTSENAGKCMWYYYDTTAYCQTVQGKTEKA